MEDRTYTAPLPVPLDDRRRIDEICRFRVRVWQLTEGVAPAAFPNGRWKDDCDERATHWIVLDERDRLVGAARLVLSQGWDDVLEPNQYMRYGIEPCGLIAAPDRVVVSPAVQGRGIASALLAVQEQAAEAAGARIALRQASPRMARLLVRRGWQLLGPAIEDARFPGVEFTVAVKDFSLAHTRDERTGALGGLA